MKTDKKQARWRRILRRAASLLERTTWIRGTLARDKEGLYANPGDEDACQFCTLGAIAHVSNVKVTGHGNILYDNAKNAKSCQLAINKLGGAVGSVWSWNDHTTSLTKDQVVAKLREVANS